MAIIYEYNHSTMSLLCLLGFKSNNWISFTRERLLNLTKFFKSRFMIWVSLNVSVDFMFCAVCSTLITKCTIMERSLFAVTKHVESPSWSCAWACACDGGGGGRVPPVACSARTAARQSTTPPPTVHTSCLLSVRAFILVSVPCSCWFDFICRLIFYQCCVF